MKYTKVINGNLSQIKINNYLIIIIYLAIASKTYNNIHKIYKFNNIILRSPSTVSEGDYRVSL
jgi:hypothetical protein